MPLFSWPGVSNLPGSSHTAESPEGKCSSALTLSASDAGLLVGLEKISRASSRLHHRRNLYPKLTKYCEDLTRRALEELWRDRVMHARERYIQKRLISEALADECLGLLPWDDPVVGLAFRRSLRRESDALQRYSQVLKIFSDLVVRGIEPPE